MKLKLIRKLKYYSLKLLRIRKSDHTVAIGFIAGFFHCWFPTFGIGTLLSLGLAKLLRGNLVAAIIASTLGTLLWPFLFFLNYKSGFIMGSLFNSPNYQLEDALDEPIPEPDYSEAADHFNSISDIGLSFLTGSIINSILFSIIGYFIVRFVLKHYRLPLLKKLKRRRKL
ncbi:hypothetical protein BK133_04440 [Paenibacillus sp. FSL H8-0548]|uniref:DUF2062 domain-containing protein n=1 Tax=Paenibacillus sp. FSL H8-0548 TaxID=1920422 RepID=UPI00096D94B9|nr:DUF2062 domain-containing protein [Paenibacillus sp. FSL H8-0548]OMF37785.1 hypothetical protein BK133_04440 [Paenibacillus sp. FSL H8-0548]